MAHENFDKEHVSTSKLHMIRCVIAMAHTDGTVCDEERAYINALMSRLPLTNEQNVTLAKDLQTPQDVSTLFKHINDPRYRGQTVYFARIMAFKDGKLEQSEQELLDQLHTMATNGLDVDSIRADAQKAVALELAEHDLALDRYRERGGIFGLFDRIMLSQGIDLMKD